MPVLKIIIPNYNGKEHLTECLNSLRVQTYSDFEILVVDNNSNDGSAEFLKEKYSEVIMLMLDKNYGFAIAVNRAINYTLKDEKIKYILLLNNDVVCERNFLENLLKGFINNEVFSVAGKMINYYDRNIIDDCGDFLNKYGLPYARGHSEIDTSQYDKPEFIFGCCAGSGLYRREAFEMFGMFDERFIAFYEDVDFALRLQLAGKKCYYVPDAVCFHKRGGTYNKRKYYSTKMCNRNLVIMRFKNYSFRLLLKNSYLFLIGELFKYYYSIRNCKFKELYFSFVGFVSGLFNVPYALKNRTSRFWKIQNIDKWHC